MGTHIGTRLYTALNGKQVGKDSQGNRYYQERRDPKGRRRKRWVIYHGEREASRVPAEWHGWLHYMIDELPDDQPIRPKPWQAEHQPNRTGTPDAWHPPGSEYEGGKRAAATGDYEPWRPS